MNNSDPSALRRPFTHIYVEHAALSHPRTERILKKYPDAAVIPISDYKQVFNRPRQAAALQKQAPDLILAIKKPPLLYKGAAVCQSFGEEHFYYVSCVKNCLFDCEYCYLQGMYPSGNLLLFVNTEDLFRETEALLKKHPVYLCISFDTDLPALEELGGYLAEWADFAQVHPSLTIEVRTKSAALSVLSALPVLKNMIWAVTLSPEEVIGRFEHKTAGLSGRLRFLKQAITNGRPVRLCFDPLLAVADFEQVYGRLFETVFSEIPAKRIRDIGIGTFRIGADYLKRMRRNRPCEVTMYPYTLTDGVYGYDEAKRRQLLGFVREALLYYVPEEKLFFDESGENHE